MTPEPEALRLAHDLKDYWEGMESHHVAALHRCAVVMLREQHAEIERLRDVLRGIAANACCEPCQEAALVAKAALGDAR